MSQWWRSTDLVNLVAHWLVENGQIDSCRGLLAYYEHPEDHDEAWRSAMREVADGKEREPLRSVPRVKPPQRPVPVPVEHVGVRQPPVIVRPDQPCLFELGAVA